MRTLQDMSQRELEVKFGLVENELRELNVVRKGKQAVLAEVSAEMKRRKEEKKFRPGVSDHAVLRYMERIMGFDVEGLRAKLLSPVVVGALKCGAGRVTESGVTYLLRDNNVITIVDRASA